MVGRVGSIAAAFGCAALFAPAVGAAHTPVLDASFLSGQSTTAAESAAAPLARAEGCPTTVDPAAFTNTARLFALNKVMSDFGPRPTASRAHARFVNWLDRSMRRMPQMHMESMSHAFERWLERRSSLRVLDGSPKGQAIRLAGAVPYSQPTAGGVSAPLVHVPADTQIDAANARGKIVVRDFVPASIPNAVFTALEWWSYDPDLVLTKTIGDNYERDWLSGQRQVDLRAAKDAGATGLVFVHDLPYDQVKGHYAPYDGIRWGIPALYVGADEGAQLKRAAESGRSARLALSASESPATTRTLIATLPGMSDERIVVTSHTDGINAIWDNGPISMLAMAKYYAALPQECRPRTLQFVFSTGHLFQALGGPGTHDGSARMMAERLDSDYDRGTVAAVLAVEHMGARSYAAEPWPGHAGRRLVPTALDEPTSFFFGESPAISAAVLQAVVHNDLRETIALRGADLPGPHIPPHRSFGGEGGPYHQRLVPTIAHVAGPWTLFNPAFGLEAIDPEKLHAQTLVFADIVHGIETTPREVLGGGYLAYREARNVFCSSAFGAFGLAECPSAATTEAHS